MSKKVLCILFGLCILAGAMLACGDSSANSGATASSNATQQAPAKKFKAGEEVVVGNTWKVVVNSIKTYTSDNQYEQPKEGNQFVVVNVTLTNISKEEKEANAYNFSLKGGTNGTKYDTAIVDAINNTPSGKVEPGDKITGDLPYEVKASEKTFILGFEADVLSSGQTQWELSL